MDKEKEVGNRHTERPVPGLEITYIWHDCFLVRIPGAALLFDFWLNEDGEDRFPAALESLDPSEPLYVFVSHGHKDHYNPRIFELAQRFPRIHYIVSRDVWRRMRHIVSSSSVYTGAKVDPDRVSALTRGESFSDDTVRVKALPSTDIGNSYIVGVGGKMIFHAGDLNAWLWLDDSTEQEIRKSLGDWHACLGDVAAAVEGRTLDAAFFPVDSRIGRGYERGASEFVRAIRTDRFFPMHFGLGDRDERDLRARDAARAADTIWPGHGQFIPLQMPGSTYIC